MSRAGFGAARLIAAASACALLAACGGSGGGDAAPASPPAGAHSLGLMQITISGIGGAQMTSRAELLSGTAGPQAHVALPTAIPAGLDVQQASASTVDIGVRGAGGERYFTVAYQVRNAQFCGTPGTCAAYTAASHNLTLVAANTTSNIANTAISAISLYDGSSDAATQALATSLLPTHGMEFDTGNGAGVMVQPGLESLQVFTEDEVSATSIPLDSGATDLFPYGYVVSNVHTPGSRALPANPAANQWDGEVSFSFKLPLQSDPKRDPYSITMMFDVIDDANTRVTQSAEEQNQAGDFAANLRAATLGSVDLAVLGGRVTQTNIGDPICTVRTAGTAGAPTATLANNAGVTVASGPNNAQGVAAAAAINAGFCAPMDLATATPATFLVSGSQSGLRTATGAYSGSYAANAQGNVLSFTPGKPFFPGETVSYTLSAGLGASGGGALSKVFSGSYTVATGSATGLVPSTGTFANSASPAVANASFAIATGDFDGDGKLDMVSANDNAGTVSILHNNGDGSFTVTGTPAAGTNVWSVTVGDFNGDGYPDIAVVNQIPDFGDNPPSTVSILLNDGHGNFALSSTVTVGADGDAIAVGDFNGDGHPDLAVGGINPDSSAGAVYILLNNGSGGFAMHGWGNTPFDIADSIAVGDFNGDGTLDVAEVGQGDGVTLLFNDGAGNLSTGDTFTTGVSPRAVVAGDFNGDGKMDLATANVAVIGPASTASILLGDGKGGFTPAVDVPIGVEGRAITAGDFNGDGYPDLAVANLGNSTASILLNNGHGVFSLSSTLAAAGSPEGIAAGDFDGDGRLDVAVQTYSGTIVVLTGQH